MRGGHVGSQIAARPASFQIPGKAAEAVRNGRGIAAPGYAFLPRVPDQGKAGQSRMTEVLMRLGSLLLVVWLVIGGLAAGQRGDYKSFIGSCSRASTIAVTILAGPLNYVGVNPDINCTAPRPSS